MRKIKHIIGLCLAAGLLALSFTSCKTPLEPEPSAKEILEKAGKTFTLPEYKATESFVDRMALPSYVDVEGTPVKVTWTVTGSNDFNIKNNVLQ